MSQPNQPVLPKNVTRLAEGESFCFSCHPAIACFTDCCRQLELPLTPYDVLRLKRSCGLSSEEFLDRFVIIEHDGQEAFPRLYLSMVDDGRESCVFVSKQGCTVYADRPGACRAYPLGRAAIRKAPDNTEGAADMDEFFVLLKEQHCQGFAELQSQNISRYSAEQGLDRYNHFNDAVASILQHDQIRAGKKLSEAQIDQFVLALYNLDTFRRLLFAGELPQRLPLTDTTTTQQLANDEELLRYGIQWLAKQIFGDHA